MAKSEVPDVYKRPYLDSSVYIALIKDEKDRGETARAILQDAQNGRFQVVGSTWVIAEVIRMKGEGVPITEEQEKLIDSYLFHEYITWVEVDITLAHEARRLSRTYGLKPADAVHLASAVRGGADQLLRWNGRFVKPNGVVEGIRVCDPYWSGQLPFKEAP